MAKNKNHHNYSNYSNYSNNKPKTETEKVEEVVATEAPAKEAEPIPTQESVEVKQEETVETPTIQRELPQPTIGIVSNCAKLRVRAAANTDADILCEIESNSEVTIDTSQSTKDFYKVCTSAGVEGFCMKKFIVPVK